MSYRLPPLHLSSADAALLQAVATTAGVPRAMVLRWALRFYAISGPWTWVTGSEREILLGSPGPLEVGPTYQGVR